MFENIDDKPEIIDRIFRDILITILSEDYPFSSEVTLISIDLILSKWIYLIVFRKIS